MDCLFIFVVEENRSVFDFVERFAMVCEGTSDLKNVKVVPSGPFILSQMTFPEYFLKVADEDLIKNVDYDVTLFADSIAKPLNIKYRFVGEEPEDAVTLAYNEAMKRILPSKGIQVIEIPRKEIDELFISASRVRKYLAQGETEKAYNLVPESTKQFI